MFKLDLRFPDSKEQLGTWSIILWRWHRFKIFKCMWSCSNRSENEKEEKTEVRTKGEWGSYSEISILEDALK